MSNMKRWLREHGISYAQLAKQLNQSQPSISQKVNLKTCWQFEIVVVYEMFTVSRQILFRTWFPMKPSLLNLFVITRRCLSDKGKAQSRFGASKPGVCNTSNVGRSGVWRQ